MNESEQNNTENSRQEDIPLSGGEEIEKGLPPEQEEAKLLDEPSPSCTQEKTKYGFIGFTLKGLGYYVGVVVLAIVVSIILEIFFQDEVVYAVAKVLVIVIIAFFPFLVVDILLGAIGKKRRTSIANKLRVILPGRNKRNENDTDSVSEVKPKSRRIKKPLMIFACAAVLLIFLFCFFLMNPRAMCPHEWADATCTTAKTCTLCKTVEGDPLGHDWTEATCTNPKTCTRCGLTEGQAPGHMAQEWTVTKEATCTEEGIKSGKCITCGETVTDRIAKTAHVNGEWVVSKEPTESTPGTRDLHCAVCNQVIESESFTATPEEIKQSFIGACQNYSYEDLARNPDSLKNAKVSLRGEVVQVMNTGSSYTLRVNITESRYIWDDTIMVEYSKPSGAANIIEKDIIDIYGTMKGSTSYTSVLGAKITLPLVGAKYIDIE